MRLRPICLLAAILPLGSLASAPPAPDPVPLNTLLRPELTPGLNSPAVQPAPRDRPGISARGPLPDPALLDGSSHPAEKKPEYGMLGEFEIPGGDEKSDRIGGQPEEKPAGGPGPQEDKARENGGNQSPSAQQQMGGGGAESAAASRSGGGAAGGKASGGGGSANAIAQSDPNAAAEGGPPSGVSSPDGEAAGGQGTAGTAKPGEMKIGDPGMQIKTHTPTSAPNVVGLPQPAGKDTPQEYGRMASGQPDSKTNVNRGVEKGRTMPSGL